MAGEIPIVVARDEAGTIRGFVNACRHHFNPVALGDGGARTFQCGYHGWTYGLDGRLRHAPASSRESRFDGSELGLIPTAVDLVGPLVSVNPRADATGLREALPGTGGGS